MKITLIQIGKTTEIYLNTGIEEYTKRLAKYTQFDIKTIPYIKNAAALSPDNQKTLEANQILKLLNAKDFVVLLDENGSQYTSVQLAKNIEKMMVQAGGALVFVVGGAYGFAPEIYARANQRLALSLLTFPHQLVRLLFVEQLYRAFSILKNEPYHHQ
jgi:23S rRNA (pseudouridine1915-N3)-methyltransferase